MRKLLLLLVVVLFITGCTSTGVQTNDWSLDMDRLLTSTDFDEANVVIDPNGVVSIEFKKFSSDQQKLIDLLNTVLSKGTTK